MKNLQIERKAQEAAALEAKVERATETGRLQGRR
jgi:hypothetical protein